MLKSCISASIFAVGLLSTNVTAQSCKTIEADKTAVIDAMRTLYAAATVDDMAKMHSVVAPGSRASTEDTNMAASMT